VLSGRISEKNKNGGIRQKTKTQKKDKKGGKHKLTRGAPLILVGKYCFIVFLALCGILNLVSDVLQRLFGKI